MTPTERHTEALATSRWANPIIEHHEDWTIEVHDDQPIEPGKKYAADLRVWLYRGDFSREFTYPSYRIWTLLAHWTDDLDAITEAGS